MGKGPRKIFGRLRNILGPRFLLNFFVMDYSPAITCHMKLREPKVQLTVKKI